MKRTKTELLKMIQKHFPDTEWKSAKYISEGYENDVIALDNATIFRFPKNPHAKKLLKGEVALLNTLRDRMSVPIPAYTLVAKDYSCAQYPMIKGEKLKVGTYKSLSVKQKNLLAKQIANFLTELHSVPISTVKECNVRERFAPQELKLLHRDAKKYVYPKCSLAEKKRFETFFHELADVFQQSYKKVLVHGDFSGNHMLLDPKHNLVGVIDFSDRAFHDPAFDFVYLWGFGQPLVEAVCTHYHGERAGILQRSNVYAKASAIWNMIESIKQKTPEYFQWYRRFKKLSRVNKVLL